MHFDVSQKNMSREMLTFGLLPALLGVCTTAASVFLAIRTRSFIHGVCAFTVTIAVSFAILVLYRMFFTVTWPSPLPYFLIGLTALIVLSQISFSFTRPRTLRWWFASGFSIVWIAGLIALVCNIGVKRTEIVSVRWSFSGDRADAYGKQVILLDGSTVSGAVASDEIATFLKSTNPSTIPVEIIRTYDLGKLRGWRIQKIAGISNSHLWLNGGIKE